MGDMQRAMRVLAMGLDYRRYARFELLVPLIFRSINGDRDVRPIPGLQLGDEEYQFCKQFVIETALHLAELDFDLDVHAMVRMENRSRQAARQAETTQAKA